MSSRQHTPDAGRQTPGEEDTLADLYPVSEPFAAGRLEVGDGHSLHWETCGRAGGKPALVLHGGPGSGCTPWHRRLFDPDRYRVVLFDQRNCGRSTPHGSEPGVDLITNTTHHLVADIERVRQAQGIEQWLVLGGSWGSTLALAYAEAHPERVSELVLFGVTAGLHREFDRIFRGGLASRFPAAWKRLRDAVLTPDQPDGEVADAVHRLLFDPDPEVRDRAALEWCLWESALSEWPPSTTLLPRYRDPRFALCFSRIVTHYVRHSAWLEDAALVRGLGVIADVAAVLIDGRHDPQTTETAEELVRQLPRARHVVVEDASHSAANRNITSELVRATDRFAAGWLLAIDGRTGRRVPCDDSLS
ncbi:MAG: prolyl aminopeptidase [Myxococcota bacterium]